MCVWGYLSCMCVCAPDEVPPPLEISDNEKKVNICKKIKIKVLKSPSCFVGCLGKASEEEKMRYY